MFRTKLVDRCLPNYTAGEERFNMTTHIVGGALGVGMGVACLFVASIKNTVLGIIGSAIYSFTLILVYTMSSIYHGMKPSTAKKVMQVLDHCAIYFLIAGTYTPIIFSAIRPISSIVASWLLVLEWGLAVIAATLTAIDLKRFQVLSMVCYIFMGWCIMLFPKTALTAIPRNGFWLLLSGGIVYSIGAVLYGLGKKKKYTHGIFHIFVVAGSLLQFFCILFYVL